MKVELSNYDPSWPKAFQAERGFLQELIGDWLVGTIEHVGSTAVLGIVAKPVIDIMFGVESLPASSATIEILARNGYCHHPYKADVMHWFCKPSPEMRTHHLHLIPYHSPLWIERITFRDILRNKPDVAREYAELKQALAADLTEDREAYTQRKWPFIKRVLNGAKNG